jgi:hypothetical protein
MKLDMSVLLFDMMPLFKNFLVFANGFSRLKNKLITPCTKLMKKLIASIFMVIQEK